MMDQLPLLVTILLYLQRQGLLSLLTTVHTIIHGGKIFIDSTEDIGYLLLGVMGGSLQGITLVKLVRETLS